MNKVILGGTLEKDLEIEVTPSKKEVCTTQLKCFNDETKKSFLLIDCVFWNEKAQQLCSSAKKGNYIEVEGRLSKTNFKTGNGATVYKTEVIVDKFEIVSTSYSKQEETKEQVVYKQPTSVFAYNEDDLPF